MVPGAHSIDVLQQLALGRDNEFEIAKLDRSLRDKVRNDLGLPSRPDRKQLDLSEHARQNGIDPSVELQKEGQKTGVRKKRLQTLLLPENLEARLETVRDLARLSEQEMGFSTLFREFREGDICPTTSPARRARNEARSWQENLQHSRGVRGSRSQHHADQTSRGGFQQGFARL
jgi:hypothetical protein